MAHDGMTPAITITDPSIAYAIAEALRCQADAKRRVADRLASPAYIQLAGTNARNAARLIGHANRLDSLASDCERQGIEAEYADSDTVRIALVR